MKSITRLSFEIFVLSFLCFNTSVFARENTDSVAEITPSLSLVYWYNSDDTIILKADIYVRRESGMFNLENAEIRFSVSNGNENKELGTVKAGYDGKAILKVPVSSGFLKNKDGKATFMADFKGQGPYLEASAEVIIKLAQLKLSFSKEDSIHTINIKAEQIEGNGEIKPIQGETVSIYVPRMLSDLKIGEITLDENGTGSIEYTGGLVGDSLGNLEIVAKIEENDNFGNVSCKSVVSWGIPKQYFLAERPTRELWTPIAPVWMIVTLIIMLAGVWGHYIYAVIQLILIKKLSKQKKDYL